MASTSRQPQPLLQVLGFLLAILWVSRSSVSAASVEGFGSFNNTGCANFWVESSCVLPLLSDNHSGFQFAFYNHVLNPLAYTLSVVWVAYPENEAQYQRVVWSANRNHPVRSGAWITFVSNGSLVLYDTDGSEVWSTKTDNVGATGIDLNGTSGELVLYGDQNQTIWSTFSHPTDSIVAGQQLVLGMQLVSGNSSSINSEGAYSLVMEPAGLALYASMPDPQPYLVWNYFAQSQEAMPVSSLLTTCDNPVTLELPGNGQVALSLPENPSSSPNPIPDNYTSSQALCSLTSNYRTIKTKWYPNPANMSYMILESDGNLRLYEFYLSGELSYLGGLEVTAYSYNFFDDTQCGLPDICGGYGVCKENGRCYCPSFSVADPNSFQPNSFLPNSSVTSKGCFYSGGPLENPCTSSAREHMGQVKGVDYYSNKLSSTGIITSMAGCESLCLKNCSCTASFYNSESRACHTVSQPLMTMTFTDDDDMTNSTLTAFLKISGVARQNKSSRTRAVWIRFGIPSFVLFGISVIILGLGVLWFRKRARLAQDLAKNSEENEFLETLPGLPPRYSRKELDGATMGFTNKLGSGGYGTVYEGTLKDGSKIAVKKLESSNSTKNFRAEMATLGSIHHINLVRLKGFCAEGVENMLVYEYMPKGSLDKWLFNTDPKSASLISDSLDWETRFKISLGTARCLAYLHDECSDRIIHMDIKPQNILLDDDFNPKVADFGLSKLVGRDMSTVVTTLRGTPGYLAPEWLLQAAITEKTDVYSYGVVLLELVAGRRCRDYSKQEVKQQYLPSWLIWCILHGDTLGVVDPRLDVKGSEEQVTTAIHIALQCIQDDAIHRPSMREVVQMLEGLICVPEFQRDTISRNYRFLEYLEADSSSQQPIDLGGRSNFDVSSKFSILSVTLNSGIDLDFPSGFSKESLSSKGAFLPVSPVSSSRSSVDCR